MGKDNILRKWIYLIEINVLFYLACVLSGVHYKIIVLICFKVQIALCRNSIIQCQDGDKRLFFNCSHNYLHVFSYFSN